jgi:integrase/recombinase XerD
MSAKTIRIRRLYHRGAFRLALFFDYDSKLISWVKTINARYSRSWKCWYVDDEDENSLKVLSAKIRPLAYPDYKQLNINLSKSELYHYYQQLSEASSKKKLDERSIKKSDLKKQKKLQQFVPDSYREKMIRRRYAESTIRTYVSYFSQFLEHIKPRTPEELCIEEIEQYMLKMVQSGKVSLSTQNQIVNAIKFYYEHILGLDRRIYNLERPRKAKRLPKVISKEAILKIFKACPNLKHRSILALIYSAGLRRGELINLRISDLDFDRGHVFIRGGKGKKDRVSLLSDNAGKLLKAYLAEYKPNYWLYEGPRRNKYSTASVGAILHKACDEAGIKRISPHILRHSFATHLMDFGTDTRIIQKLLGHEKLETTAIYTHVSTSDLQKISSPLDSILAEEAGLKRDSENRPT